MKTSLIAALASGAAVAAFVALAPSVANGQGGPGRNMSSGGPGQPPSSQPSSQQPPAPPSGGKAMSSQQGPQPARPPSPPPQQRSGERITNYTAPVERSTHGSIRRADANAVPRRPEPFHHDAPPPPPPPNVIVHRDVEVDIHRPHYWHDFCWGSRHPRLRPSCVQIVLGSAIYFYDDGIFYQSSGPEYVEVYAPVGAPVSLPPPGSVQIVANGVVYYYACGVFYVQQGPYYVVAPPPAGAIVPELPPGANAVYVANGVVAYQFNNVFYRPAFVNGVTQYIITQY